MRCPSLRSSGRATVRPSNPHRAKTTTTSSMRRGSVKMRSAYASPPSTAKRSRTPCRVPQSSWSSKAKRSSSEAGPPPRATHANACLVVPLHLDRRQTQRQSSGNLLLAFFRQRVVLSGLHVTQQLLEPHACEVRGAADRFHGLGHGLYGRLRENGLADQGPVRTLD